MKIEDKVDAVYIPDDPSRIKATDYNQIKNEIQGCISLAGLTPTKDVIQLPESLKILTKQSGAEEVAKIEAAGSAQLSFINTAGNTQKTEVETAGATQKSAVESAGSQQVDSINAAGEIQTANAAAQAELAKKWANKIDGSVDGGEYSAKKYALDAAKEAEKLKTYITIISESSGNITLEPDTVCKAALNGATVFAPQTPTDVSIHHQIKLFVAVTGTPTINWGTATFFNEAVPDIKTGEYVVYYDYDPNLSGWVCGAIRVGSAL